MWGADAEAQAQATIEAVRQTIEDIAGEHDQPTGATRAEWLRFGHHDSECSGTYLTAGGSFDRLIAEVAEVTRSLDPQSYTWVMLTSFGLSHANADGELAVVPDLGARRAIRTTIVTRDTAVVTFMPYGYADGGQVKLDDEVPVLHVDAIAASPYRWLVLAMAEGFGPELHRDVHQRLTLP